MPVAPTYKNPTGKNNALTSFNKWLATNVPPANAADCTYAFSSQLLAAVFPRVEVSEFQYFDSSNSAYGMNVFPAGAQKQGKLNQAMIEFNIYDDVVAHSDAKRHIYQVRDRLIHGLTLAGYSDDITNVVAVPPIALLDYDQLTPTDTNILVRVPFEQDNAVIERYYAPTADSPNIHRIQLLIKVEWYELN